MFDVKYQKPLRLFQTIETILLPIDGSEDSAQAATVAFELVGLTGAKLVIVHIINTGMVQHVAKMTESDYEDVLQKYHETGHALLESYRTAAKENDIDAEIFLDEGLPSQRIIQLAKERGACLIVMASKGATGGRFATLGSTTERVIRGSTCPVLVVKKAERKR